MPAEKPDQEQRATNPGLERRRGTNPCGPAYARLREHCLTQLRAATSKPVEPPADWRRDAELGCNCEDCRAVARFLADPGLASARFPLAEARRRHLHSRIEHQRCDCTHVTERKGRPYTLVCTKTNASYERREKQYQHDCGLLEEIEKLPDHGQAQFRQKCTGSSAGRLIGRRRRFG